MNKLIVNSNVVINLIGANHTCKTKSEFYYANVLLPGRIAKLAKKNKIKRLIHFSSVGADLNSPSWDLQTKAQGELEVKKYFPQVTILRLCPVVGY